MGGVAGVAASVFARVAGWSLIVEPWAVASAVLFSMQAGIVFGWYPALRASRLAPIEAIRAV